MIKLAQGHCGKEELDLIAEALDYGYFGMAYNVPKFEEEIKAFLGTEYGVVCVNTCTSALHLALDAIGIDEGDEVILPSFTFVATVQAITACRGTPVFCDIDETGCIDFKKIVAKVTSKTKAIMIVHYNGQPVNDLDKIYDFGKKHGIRIVEDAAHAFGSYYKGKKIGSIGDIVCFSFDSIKVMTCGEGGAVVTKDEKVLESIRYKRLLGMKRSAMADPNWKNRNQQYDVPTNGFRYHMSNINAAIGLAQIKKLEGFLKYRKELVHIYLEQLKGNKNIEFFDYDYDHISNFMFPIKVKNGLRDELQEYLSKNDIEAKTSYVPIHYFTFYSKYDSHDLQNTERIYEEVISIPLHTRLSKEQVMHVAEVINRFTDEKSKK